MAKLDKPNSFRGAGRARTVRHLWRKFVAETLMPLILSLEKAYAEAKADPAFHAELNHLLKHYVGRPSPLYFAERLTERLGGAKIYFKRDELNHTGAHKINNVLGQILLARRMGKQRIIAETGAGQHGVATATACARFGLDCVVYMGEVDVERQKPNVFRMKMLGAEVRPVTAGARTLKDAMNEALRDWVTNVADTFYCIGTAAGPHPYPMMVRDFQCVIGEETAHKCRRPKGACPTAWSPRSAAARTRSASSIPFLDDEASRSSASRRRGTALRSTTATRPRSRADARRPARPPHLPAAGRDGQILEAHSISAGLDYPAVGPEHSLAARRRPGEVPVRHRRGGARRLPASVDGRRHHPGALAGPRAREGDRTRAEAAHADLLTAMILCGRGDKDIFAVAERLGGM